MSASDDAIEPELVPAAMAGLATPGAILTRMRNVDADVRALDGELQAQRARLPASFVRGWAHWRDAWRRFYTENEGYAARVWPGTLTEVEAFARRVRDWRRAAERAGAELATPGASRPARPAPLPELPSLSQVLPNLPDLSPLRDLARALPDPAALIDPARQLLEQSPLSARYWENLKPVVLAGAFTVGGLGLLWIVWNLRVMTAGTRRATERVQSGELDKLLPLIASRGLVR